MVSPVNDPKILAALNSKEPEPVTDPALLAVLNGAQPNPPQKQGWYGAAKGWGGPKQVGQAALRAGQLVARGVNNTGMGLINMFVADPAVAGYNLYQKLKPRGVSDLVTGGPKYAELPSSKFARWQDERAPPPKNLGEQALEVGVGTLAGLAIPLGPKSGLQAPLQTGAQRRAYRAAQEVGGDDATRMKLAEALRNAKKDVAGVKPTSAEAVSGMPEGSPIQALQETIAKISGESYGSPSIEFGKQFHANQLAREAAKKSLSSSHGAKREAILSNANNLSSRLRNLTSYVSDRLRSKASALQDKGRFDTTAAEQTRRSLYKDAPTGPVERKLGLAKGSVPYPSQAVGATPRPPPRYTSHAARGEEALTAADDAAWIADVRQLEAAGAQLEKELLENSGLVSLGPKTLLSGAKGAMSSPRVYANEVASKTYQTFVDDIQKITRKDGSIDARALDEVRKLFGPKLTKLFEKEGWNTNDASFVQAMRSAQGFIDDAIEAAGGTGYKAELSRYSDEIGKIKADELRFENMYKTTQPTLVPIAKAIDDQVMKGIRYAPGLISWKLTAAKRAAEEALRNSEPKIVKELAKLLRNPDDLAWALDKRNTQGASEALRRALKQYTQKTVAPSITATQESR